MKKMTMLIIVLIIVIVGFSSWYIYEEISFGIHYGSKSTTTMTMNNLSSDDAANTVVWTVFRVEEGGGPLKETDVNYKLRNATGSAVNGTGVPNLLGVTFTDSDGDGYISSGDTFVVTAVADGTYRFWIAEKSTDTTVAGTEYTKY